ncbi:MAG: NADH-quinone oxidoreductase subunit H [Dehalococcoidia bacterium]|nr:NADH-quinone oxidoreductase subunit H [Dehalococcoidia bacterium]
MKIEVMVFQVAGFVLAPLLLGIINRTKALFAGRTGAPFAQPYYDLWRLLHKSAVYSDTATFVFKMGPMVGLAAIGIALLIVPFGRSGAPLSFSGDIFLLAGLMALSRFVTVLAAMDTGSAFEGMGASREVTFAALAEPSLFLSLIALALTSGSMSLTGILGAIGWSSWSGGMGPALAMVAAAMFLLLLVENARIPVDDPNTHLELTMIHEVMVLDHSGPDFGYISYGAALKMWLFASLVAGVALPVTLANHWIEGGVYMVAVLLVGVAVGVVESIMARMRMVNVPHLLVGSGVLGVLGVALAIALK